MRPASKLEAAHATLLTVLGPLSLLGLLEVVDDSASWHQLVCTPSHQGSAWPLDHPPTFAKGVCFYQGNVIKVKNNAYKTLICLALEIGRGWPGRKG